LEMNMSFRDFIFKTAVKKEKLSDYKRPSGNNEHFGWYNPSTKEVVYEDSFKTNTPSPGEGWYSWHSHPAGAGTNPSEIDLLNTLGLFDGKVIEGDQYIFGDDGLVRVSLDREALKMKWEAVKKELGIDNPRELFARRGEPEYKYAAPDLTEWGATVTAA
jgi:hypothetical protein